MPTKCGCYANGGPLAMHWAKVTRKERGDNWSTFIANVSSFKDGLLSRHNQAGDLAGDGKQLDADANDELANAYTGKRGFTYTHYPVLTSKHNARVVKRMNDTGFVVNLSANNVKHADALYDLGIGPVATVLPEAQTTNTTTPKGRKIVVCRCNNSCMMYHVPHVNYVQSIVMQSYGFPAHGSSKREADNVLHEDKGLCVKL